VPRSELERSSAGNHIFNKSTSRRSRTSEFSVASLTADASGVAVQPTPDQAALIREVLGIRTRQEISAATLERLKAFAFARNSHGTQGRPATLSRH
jgi:hypothetical protein